MLKFLLPVFCTLPALFGADASWKQATIHQDRAALDRVLHNDLTYTHSSAHTQTKAEVIESAITGKPKVESIEFTGTTVRVYGNTALVTAMVEAANNTAGKTSVAKLLILYVWIKDQGKWKMVARQATKPAQ